MVGISSFALLYGIYLNIVGCYCATKSGPYIATLVRAEKCANPTQPYLKEVSGKLSLQLFKTGKKTLLRGNYTSYKLDSSVKIRVQESFFVNDQWQLTFSIEGMSCRGRIVAMLADIFGIKFNKKTCSAPKGVYVFNNIDYDLVDHVIFTNREYGRVMRKMEAYNKHGTMMCVEVEAVVTPKNKQIGAVQSS